MVDFGQNDRSLGRISVQMTPDEALSTSEEIINPAVDYMKMVYLESAVLAQRLFKNLLQAIPLDTSELRLLAEKLPSEFAIHAVYLLQKKLSSQLKEIFQ